MRRLDVVLRRHRSVDRRLLDALPLATAACGGDGSVLHWNAAAERLFGWRGDELAGRPNPIVAAHELPAACGVEGIDVVRPRRDGTEVELSVFATPLGTDAGPPGSYLVVFRDVGPRNRAERARQGAERRYRELVEALPLVTYVDELAPGSPNLYTSPQIRDLLGWEPSDWADDTDFLEKVHPDDRERVVACIEHESASREPLRIEYRVRHRDGHYVWVRDDSAIVVDDDGRAFSRGFLLDITEEKRLEAQLLQAQKMEAIGQLAGSIAHDFNNLLTGIVGHADLAAASTRDPAVARCLAGIRAATGEAAGLTGRLLAFSRRDVPERRPVDVNEAVRATVDLLDGVLRRDVRLELEPLLPRVTGDPAHLKQVVLNLALNAREAMPDGGSLLIATAAVDDRVVLRVVDSGCGMDDETRERAPEPFFTTKAGGEGTGLGLAVVHGIVESCGGSVAIRSTPGAGTSVTVELPAAEAKPVEPAAPEQGAVEERVLVVEDRDVVRDLACSILDDAGYAVCSAACGAEALDLAAHEPPFALVLTDVVMPEMSGAELVRRLRTHQPGLRVLYMSGYAADVLGPDELRAERTGFLRKPFGTAELTAAVRELLLEPAAA